MGIPSDMRDNWVKMRQSSLFIASPAEDHRISRTKQCTEVEIFGFDILGMIGRGCPCWIQKAASIACVASAVPTFAAVRMIPWAKANLNYTAQALIISAASIVAYFITADKTILECARRNSQNNLQDKSV